MCQDEEEKKKLKPTVPIADDEEEATLDQPVPMSLEKPYTEADDPMVKHNQSHLDKKMEL